MLRDWMQEPVEREEWIETAVIFGALFLLIIALAVGIVLDVM